MIRIAVVEDDADQLEALRRCFHAEPDFAVLCACARGRDLLAALARREVDVVLVDLGLPDIAGEEVIAALRQRDGAPEVMALTVFEEPARILRALRAGATGYLTKDTALPEVAEAVRQLVAGGSPISPRVARHILRQLPPAEPPASDLTPRERQVLEELVDGSSLDTVAARLGISAQTVKSHVKRVYAKLSVFSRTEAVVKGMRLGLISDD